MLSTYDYTLTNAHCFVFARCLQPAWSESKLGPIFLAQCTCLWRSQACVEVLIDSTDCNKLTLLDKQFASIFRLYRIARSSTILFLCLLLVYLVNTTCAIIYIMASLIFTIVSRLHAFFLVAHLPPRACRDCGNSFIPTHSCCSI